MLKNLFGGVTEVSAGRLFYIVAVEGEEECCLSFTVREAEDALCVYVLQRGRTVSGGVGIERLTTNVSCILLSLSVVYPVDLGMDAWTRLLASCEEIRAIYN
jgi:hypothetical protein